MCTITDFGCIHIVRFVSCLCEACGRKMENSNRQPPFELGGPRLVLEPGSYCFRVVECSVSLARSCGTVGTTECKTSEMIDQAGYH